MAQIGGSARRIAADVLIAGAPASPPLQRLARHYLHACIGPAA